MTNKIRIFVGDRIFGVNVVSILETNNFVSTIVTNISSLNGLYLESIFELDIYLDISQDRDKHVVSKWTLLKDKF